MEQKVWGRGWGQRIISLWLFPAFLLNWGCYRAAVRLFLLGERWGGAVKLSRLFVDQKRAEKEISSFLTDRGWERSWRIIFII